ncbi:glycosyltransferase 87 family protein [Cohnella sp. AR92]|uniref:glycosyltransferase 87 family protein n=1 Tax=Cohnella sp. AR92 TaxID=648716 RepID=UPI001315720F|nr:glycosyltransferase 87 family protein [Cohnella sp. AR92]
MSTASQGKRRSEFRVGLVVLLLVLAAIGIRWIAADRFAGFVADQRLFVQWMQDVRVHGLSGAYLHNENIDYPPVFLAIMGGYGAIADMFGVVPQAGEMSFKFLLLLIDVLALCAAAAATSGMKSVRWRIGLLALIAFNPALLTDSVVWGQVDMLHGMLMVLAILQLPRRPWLSGLLMGLALLTKFQAVALLPVLVVYLLIRGWQHRAAKPLLLWLAGLCAPWLAALVYFGAAGALGAMIRQAYADAVGEYKNVTMNALNLWFHIVGVSPAKVDTEPFAWGLSLRAFSLLLFGAAVAFICYCVGRALLRSRPEDAVLLRAGAAINFAFFMLPTEMHERYSVPALLFVLFAVMKDKRWLVAAVALTATVFINLTVVLRMYQGGGRGRRGAPGFLANPLGFGRGGGGERGMAVAFARETGLSVSYSWIAAVNVLLLIGMLASLYLDQRLDTRSRRSPPAELTNSGIEASPSRGSS